MKLSRCRAPWRKRLAACLPVMLLVPLLAPPPLSRAAETVLLDERFVNLERWQPLTFPKIARHSSYRIVRCETASCLEMNSDSSASALMLKQPFNVYEAPRLRWRWKVSNVYRQGDSRRKEGDDYPARLYVMFAYDPDRASLAKRLRYQVAKTLYGEYPPDSSISYIWDNRASGQPFIVNAYADEARMIAVDAGPAAVNTWREHSVDIVRDYRLAFGQDPPPQATLAVMNDSDNTGESATAWIEYLQLFR